MKKCQIITRVSVKIKQSIKNNARQENKSVNKYIEDVHLEHCDRKFNKTVQLIECSHCSKQNIRDKIRCSNCQQEY